MGNQILRENVIVGGGERYPTHFNGMKQFFYQKKKPLSIKK
jgi:hypothetical protein